MKLGGAYYCDDCGCEITVGDCCIDCDPENGSSSITYTFLAIEPSTIQPSDQEEDRPWWKKLFRS